MEEAADSDEESLGDASDAGDQGDDDEADESALPFACTPSGPFAPNFTHFVLFSAGVLLLRGPVPARTHDRRGACVCRLPGCGLAEHCSLGRGAACNVNLLRRCTRQL